MLARVKSSYDRSSQVEIVKLDRSSRKIFGTKFVLDENFSWPKFFFFCLLFLDQKFLDLKSFLNYIYFGTNTLFQPKIFLKLKFLGPNTFWDKKCTWNWSLTLAWQVRGDQMFQVLSSESTEDFSQLQSRRLNAGASSLPCGKHMYVTA